MDDQKYITFKYEDFGEMLLKIANDGLTAKLGEALNDLASNEITDAVVIRLQDEFAPPALDAYANSIRVALEVTKMDGGPIGRAVQLQGIADYFSQKAAEAWQMNRKIPD